MTDLGTLGGARGDAQGIASDGEIGGYVVRKMSTWKARARPGRIKIVRAARKNPMRQCSSRKRESNAEARIDEIRGATLSKAALPRLESAKFG